MTLFAPENQQSWQQARLRISGLAGTAALLATVTIMGFTAACSNGGANGQNAAGGLMAQAAPVTVAQATMKTIPVQVTAIGNGEAYSTINVKSQVDGVIESVAFREGQDVKSGDVLFRIDSRPFQATLAQSEANLARDQAQLAFAQGQLQRNQQLFDQGIISKDQFDQFRATADEYQASVKADQSAIENAKIQLGYCVIRSTIDGRTGNLMVHAGNLVKNNDATLVTINRISPIYVDFSVPEQYLPEIRKYQAGGGLKVEATVPQDTEPAETGLLSFINNMVDTSTGTILLKGTFPNPDRRLWPGQFVNVTLRLSAQPNAIVVPAQAVQTGQTGHYVFVVKPGNTVDLRPVVAGNTVDGETVIQKGVAAGETVVTDGQLRLFPGAKVEVKNAS